MTLYRLLWQARTTEWFANLVVVLIALWASKTLSHWIGLAVVCVAVIVSETIVQYIVNIWRKDFIARGKM